MTRRVVRARIQESANGRPSTVGLNRRGTHYGPLTVGRAPIAEWAKVETQQPKEKDHGS